MKHEKTPSLRTVRLMGIIFLAYAIVMPFLIFLIPESALPTGTGSIDITAWLLILLMPIDILLLYASYRYFGKRIRSNNIMGPAILMYMFAVIPSIYSFVIGFLGSSLRSSAIPLGLSFSLVGFGLAWMFISKLWETVTASDDY
jgi:hypothetical protein